ncbi:MAG TPA: SWIM zinc finger family protein [Geobacteraceae bacterium]|nr:SWIM zinc finger family protein [Geobacteraceae bacterium]
MGFYDWAPYVTVAERRARALKHLEKMKKKGLIIQPVQLSGRKIAASFWGKGWCDHMESFSDYANRLPRGRSYVRNGSVCHLAIDGGLVTAIVSGSELYNVKVSIAPLMAKKWEAVKRACSGRIGSLIDLLRGRLDHGVMEVVTHRREGLFPLPGEMKFDCDCPDWADMCKHVAAVLYGVGARLDSSPEMLFLLRGVNHEELVDMTAAVADATGAGTSRRRIAAAGIADVFGIDLAEAGDELPTPAASPARAATTGRRPKTPPPNSEKLKSARQARAEIVKTKKKAKRKSSASAPFPEPLTGDAILAWRSALGETQTAFAARVGVTAASVSQWEKKGKGIIAPQAKTITALRKAWRLTRKGI